MPTDPTAKGPVAPGAYFPWGGYSDFAPQSELLGTQFEEVPSRGEYVRLTPEADADSGG